MPFIISNFHKGQSSSPYTTDGAFSKSQNLDVFSQPGIARINYLPVACTETQAVLDIPKNIVKDKGDADIFYASDDSGNIYKIDNSTSPPTITDKGDAGDYVIHWKSYLLSVTSTRLQYNSTGTTWVNFGTSMNTAIYRLIFESYNDGKLYICNGRYISTLEENAGQNFDPASGSTFTHTTQAFTIPEDYLVLGITEQGRYIIIAAVPVNTLTIPETSFFLWDRSASTADYLPRILEANMTSLKAVGNRIFVSGGDQGKVYTFSESGFLPYAKIPFDLDNNTKIRIGVFGQSSIAFWQDKLLLGVSSDDGLAPAGIYGIKNGKICHEFLTSEGLDGSTKDIRIGAITPIDDTSFFFGWENNTDSTWGIDKVITSDNRQTSYSSYFESVFTPVATRGSKKSFDKVEVQLARPLQTGEGVRIKWRKNINDSWTTLGTQTFTTNGSVSSLEFPGIHNLENLQLQILLTTGATANTPYILEIRLLP